MIPWLKEHYNAEIITYTGDLGQGDDLPAIREKALATGASVAVVDDLRERFVKEFIFPAIMAGAKYEGTYPLHTALGRPRWRSALSRSRLSTEPTRSPMAARGRAMIRFGLR